MSRFFVGITGASGHIYAEALLRGLTAQGHQVDLAATPAGCLVLRHELGVEAGQAGELLAEALPGWLGEECASQIRAFPSSAVGAPPSSGTALTGAAIICPCSMGTLGRVRAGYSSNLVERVADVALKEGRPLVLIPRETPLSVIHLENMLDLTRMGAICLPAMPGFYHHPKSIEDLVNFVVGKIFDRLGIESQSGSRWTGLADPPEETLESPPGISAAGETEEAP